MEEIILKTIEWSAPEYTHKEKSADFLWTIGVVTIVAVILALWFRNYVFSIFIFIAGACLILFSIRKPENINFAIKTEGLSIGKDKYLWANIKGFNIKSSSLNGKGSGPYSKLMVVTSRYFLPVYTIPLPQALVDEVSDELTQVVPNIEIEESRSMIFMEKLGF